MSSCLVQRGCESGTRRKATVWAIVFERGPSNRDKFHVYKVRRKAAHTSLVCLESYLGGSSSGGIALKSVKGVS